VEVRPETESGYLPRKKLGERTVYSTQGGYDCKIAFAVVLMASDCWIVIDAERKPLVSDCSTEVSETGW